jgi:hypothetical protein
VGPRVGLDDMEKRKVLTLLEPSTLSRLHINDVFVNSQPTFRTNIYRLHFQAGRMNLATNQHESRWQAESGVKFLRNVG